ncbi:sodium ion-translocating decarboxylase subunit beta [Blastochloris viridis]|uniref:oxaloacetate decarboxylase (Na(+) extruding) n=1 Tax=Blastochloris viridis TaxID=1079 RepID=A0A0H5BPW8_BLAVI|nr:sodium ion-translocating decarboxylase subunit beta [Blastochloris viridis]ALK10086.1 Glutaconyl-CoA decarboxylase subunit beta [Blastochloris viridis]BAR99988.1 oxaloacetate decarboxylase beta chain [Blastochloris viridis]CUU42750.1 Glutaconyl-CoA decarboxylase subunit beta [Blastochloris viridis]
MLGAILDGLAGLTVGVQALLTLAGLKNLAMMAVGATLIYLGAKRNVEPLLLVPIGFGCLLVNIPYSELMQQGLEPATRQTLQLLDLVPDAAKEMAQTETGFLRTLFQFGVANELFPLLIFIGIGAMTDFTPLLANPKILLLGAAGQCGVFVTLLLALAVGFSELQAMSIAIIGACDGPTAIYVASRYAPELLGPVSVAAYSYMALVPIIQPPIMRALTTDRERRIRMPELKNSVSPAARLVFPIVATVITGLIAPKGLPLMGAIMLGNFLRECGVVSRLVKASQNEILSITTLFLGLAIGATMAAENFLRLSTLAIFGLGFFAICLDTVAGVTFGKLMCLFSGGRINPLLGAAGISAYPMAARVVQVEGQKHDRQNHLLMHAMGANTGGQIGSVAAAAVMLALVHSLAGN